MRETMAGRRCTPGRQGIAIAAIAVLALSLGVVVAGAGTAWAENVTNQTSHSYDVYQIFTGTQATGSTQLGDIQWGTGIKDSTTDKSTELIDALKANNAFGSSDQNAFYSASTAQDVAAQLAGKADKSDFANAFANEAAKHLTSVKSTLAAGATTADLGAGYYLFVDASEPGTGDASNSALLQVTNKAGGLTIEKKYTVPTPSKTIESVSPQGGSADAAIDDQTTAGTVLTETDTTSEKDSAAAEVGDVVTFRLSAQLPSNLDDYDSYKLQFDDTLSDGLEYVARQTPTVKIGDTDADASHYTVTTPSAEAPNKLTVAWNDIKQDAKAGKNVIVSIEYRARVTSNAVTGLGGNANTVTLTYSNNPNGNGEGTSNPKEVKVYTFRLNVIKTKQDNSYLAGAGFVLKNHENKFYSYDSTNNLVKWVDEVEDATQLYSHEDGKLYARADTSDTTERAFTGLAEGNYTLHEETVPAGYNSASDVSFTIDAHAQATNDSITLENTDGASIDDDGNYSITVVNNSGSVLPSTGGMGTTAFYVIGGVLIAGAIAYLVHRRKASAGA